MFQRHTSYSKAIGIQTEAPPKLITPLPSPEIMTKGAARVVYPAEYGGDPRGEEESSVAFQKALEEAFAVEEGNERELVRGVKDLGGVVIDLEGGSYKIGKPFHFPPIRRRQSHGKNWKLESN